ncbi:MAG: alpha/beta hydrolase [Synergistaceae bacterium]|nr:alpha/beta hydrolase [Synergistaceae bacterium]MBR0035310.1 alpha/beta hydrolase [Synergistaceae bacterium]
MKFNRVSVSGINIFYREAGDPRKPAMLLLHGFPSSSHMFRDLIPMLEDDFYLIAPDYPGFGQSDMPSREEFTYTFDNIAEIVDGFISAIGLERFYMYVFDYGAPIGFRLAMKHPESVLGIISQNGNVYSEGLGKKWEARAEYWAHPTKELRESYKSAFAPETIIGQYTFGTEPGSVSPDGYTLDIHYTQKPGYDEIQSDLIFDYQNNVKLYPKFQEYLREYQPKVLAVWGKNDPSFIPEGAEAFRRDVQDLRVHFVNSGHFALENCCREIADEIIAFCNDIIS